jgi:hypothetical protein
MTKAFVLFTCVTALVAQTATTPTLSVTAPARVRPGSKVTVTVALSGTTEAAALQWTLSPPNEITPVSPIAGSSATVAGKTVYHYAPTGIALVVGLNMNKMQPGSVASYTFDVPANQAEPLSFNLTNVIGATPEAAPVPIVAGPSLIVALIKKEDLNGDGTIDSIDLQISVDQIQGRSPCGTADLNGDGKCNLFDAQLLVKAGVTQ